MKRNSGPERSRCSWAGTDARMVAYHDTEWGVPVHDDRVHFEFLILEGAQAGLSWSTILNKREGYRRAFSNFEPTAVARYTPAKVERLLQDPSIVRNRAKVEAAVSNAQAFLTLREEQGSFDEWLWGLAGGAPVVRRRRYMSEIPAVTPLAEEVSRQLKRRGFKFVGPTVMYAHLQACGGVYDQRVCCFPREAVQKSS